MANIVAALYKSMEAAERGRDSLLAQGFASDAVALFALNAPGQHALYPVGGDEDADVGATDAHIGAAKGAALGGAAALALGTAAAVATGGGAIVAAAAAAVGAYTGSLVGALNTLGDKVEEKQPEPSERPSGVMVAVAAPAPEAQNCAVALLRDSKPHQIEIAEGIVRDGQWVDFDPLNPATPVD